LWIGRETLSKLTTRIFEMAARWKVRLIGIEAVGAYQALYEKAASERGQMEKKWGWIPRLWKITYPAHLTKATRIAGLEWRFDAGRVKIPDISAGPYGMLQHQIRTFSMDMKNMRWDDALDTLAMHQRILKPKVAGLSQEKAEEVRKLFAQRLVAGELFDKDTGIPYVTGMSPGDIPHQALRARRDKDRKPTKTVALPLVFTLEDLGRTLHGD